jgi:hypothetical protein
MTIAPKYPLEHAYLGDNDPMEMIDTRAGPMERWRADALLLGETSGLFEARKRILKEFDSIRSDSVALQQQVAEVTRDQRAIQNMAVKVVDMLQRADSLVKRVEAFEEKQRADAERALEEPLPSPPGDPSKAPEPPLELEDAQQPAHGDPPGDPHVPGEFPRLDRPITRDAHITPHPGKDQTEFPDPELPHPPEVQEPIAAGLDAGD